MPLGAWHHCLYYNDFYRGIITPEAGAASEVVRLRHGACDNSLVTSSQCENASTGALLIIDEVQMQLSRIGYRMAHEGRLDPDICWSAASASGGIGFTAGQCQAVINIALSQPWPIACR